ncbi:MAG: aldo/keto reductase [Oscillospiraceae bacterium]|nr:aldo/keto reductase [Oscillospiraceae bacterium]
MEYTTLGKTGRKVSKIGFGGATAGIPNYVHAFNPNDEKDRLGVIEAIREAYRLGVNYFDTAEAYGEGASESIFGEGLDGIPPQEIFLASKVAPTKNDGGKAVIKTGAEIRASLENSLKRLRRDYIDLIQIHGTYYSEDMLNELLAKGGAADALEKAKAEGLVKHIGFSIETQNVSLDRFLECGRFDVMQIQYNLLFQHPYDPYFKIGSLYKASEYGIGVAAMRTVTSGIFQKWIKLVNPANTFDYNAALIQFVLSCPLVDVALLGMRSAARVRQNVEICNDLSGRISIHDLHYRIAPPE